jgi:hypothetical protein
MKDALATTHIEMSDSDRKVVEEMQQIGFQLAPARLAVRTTSEAPRDPDEGSSADATPADTGPQVGAAAADDAGAAVTKQSSPLAHATQSRVAGTSAAVSPLAQPAPPRASGTSATAAAATPRGQTVVAQQPPTDWSLMVAIGGVVLAIAFLLFRKMSRLET